MEDLENWNVAPVQDPEQLRRLQLLYRYGAGRITALDLLCLYPVPELPEKAAAAANKSDLQTLADAIKRGYQVVNTNGEVLYCRSDFLTGSRIQKSTVCLTAEQLDAIHLRNQQMLEVPNTPIATH